MMEKEKSLFLFQILKISETRGSSAISFHFNNIDWQEIFAFSTFHNIEPLVFFHIKEKGMENVLPPNIYQQFQKSYHQNAACNLRKFHELGQILECLNKSRLPVVILKGAFLASCVYSNPALRSMQDLDILIQRQSIPAAIDKLIKIGYHLAIPPWVNSIGFHVVLATPEISSRLEIHWDLTTPNEHYKIPSDALWASTIPIEIENQQALALCPEHLIIHLCQHTAINHLFMQGLRPLIDIDRTVRRYRDDLGWKKIISLSSAWGLQKAVALTLFLCRQYLDTPSPEPVLENMGCGKIDPDIIQDTLMQVSYGSEIADAPPAGLFKVQAENKIGRKVGLFLKYVFCLPPTPYPTSPKRSKLLTAYYVFRRLIHLIGHYSGSIWKLIKFNWVGNEVRHRNWILLRWLQE
jgi:hypothetical protein